MLAKRKSFMQTSSIVYRIGGLSKYSIPISGQKPWIRPEISPNREWVFGQTPLEDWLIALETRIWVNRPMLSGSNMHLVDFHEKKGVPNCSFYSIIFSLWRKARNIEKTSNKFIRKSFNNNFTSCEYIKILNVIKLVNNCTKYRIEVGVIVLW